MSRRRLPLLLLLLVPSLLLPGRSEACAGEPVVVSASAPQAVAAAARIVLARAVALDEKAYRETFTVEEVLRGEDEGRELVLPLGPTDCDPMTLYQPGQLYLLYLDRLDSREGGEGEKGWRLSSLYYGGFPVDPRIDGPGDPLLVRVREYARIAALGGEEAREEVLRRLLEEVTEHPDLHPPGLAADLDLHFRYLTPYSPFALLRQRYERAVYPEERMEALWAVTQGRHPEALEFLRQRLASGEDLGRELAVLEPVLRAAGDPRDLELLVWAGLRSAQGAGVASRAAWQLADNAGDDRLVWQVLRAHPETLGGLEGWFESHPPTPRQWAELVRLYRRMPGAEKDRLASPLVFLAPGESSSLPYRLLLATDDPRGRTARLSGHPDALVRAFHSANVASSVARRRALLLRLLDRSGKREVARVLPLLREARAGEAQLLLSWMRGHLKPEDPIPPALTAALADARSAAEAERALWAVAAAWHAESLLPAARQLASRLPLRTAGGSPAVALLARAALSAPEESSRYDLAQALVQAAGEDDRPLLLDALRQSPRDSGEILAGWFVRHPDPAAIPALKALLDEPARGDLMPGAPGSAVATALAAAGDREIVARVIAFLERRPLYLARGLADVLRRSPLPEAAAAARRLLPPEAAARAVP
jgi:hypothetical protein